jgi:hypothetical protein
MLPMSLPTMLRPRHEFPTPLFKLAVPVLFVAAAAVAGLVVYLATA